MQCTIPMIKGKRDKKGKDSSVRATITMSSALSRPCSTAAVAHLRHRVGLARHTDRTNGFLPVKSGPVRPRGSPVSDGPPPARDCDTAHQPQCPTALGRLTRAIRQAEHTRRATSWMRVRRTPYLAPLSGQHSQSQSQYLTHCFPSLRGIPACSLLFDALSTA